MALISIKNPKQLHKDWKDISFILIDKCSLLSLELLLYDIDHALQYAKEVYDIPLEGIHLIKSGDSFNILLWQVQLYTT